MSQTQYDTFEYGIGTTTLESERGAVEDIQENSPVAVSGVAIPENTILNGGRGEEHFYPPEMAQRAAEVLQRQIEDPDTTIHIVKNFHEIEGQAPADDIIGEVTAAGYSEGVGVVWKGEITDLETAQKIEMDYLDVSPTVARSLGDFDETLQARAVDEVAAFRDIAVVGQGQPGADVEIGSNPAVEALSRAVLDTLQLQQARTPEFSGTEDTDWSTPSLEEYLQGYDTLPSDAESVDELSQENRSFIASKTLLGDADGDTLREVRFFPVVNPSTDNLNRRALVAVRGGRGQQADIPQSAWESAFRVAGRLLNEHWDADVETDPDALEHDTMSVDDAKETLADEYDVDIDQLEDHLESLNTEPEEPTDDRTVVLVEE